MDFITKLPNWVPLVLLIFLMALISYAVLIKNYSVEFWHPRLVAPNANTTLEGHQGLDEPHFEPVPKLAVTWKLVYPDKEYPDEVVRVLHQSGSKFDGELLESDATAYSIKGNITPSRHLSFVITPLNAWSSIAATKRRKAIHRRGAENAEKTTTYTQNLVQKTTKCRIVVRSSYFGVGLLKLSQEADCAEGYVVHLDEKTDIPKATRITALAASH